MPARYVAYGLDLRCSFALPGMRAGVAQELPTVALELVSAAELERSWSGASGRFSWTGTLGEEISLRIEAGRHGELRFSYGERARFLLHPSRELLECAPLCDGPHWQQTLLGRVLPDVALARGYEALHASAVESPTGVLAIAAPSGMGKTTLARELLHRGWPLVADDVLVLGTGPAPGSVVGHPGTPHMNVSAVAQPAPAVPQPLTTLGTLAGERWVAVENTARAPRPVRMICLLERAPGLPLRARALAPNPLALAPYMLGLDDDAERERRRFVLFAELIETASLVRLTGDLHATPAALADAVERALAESSPALIGGVR